MAWQVITLMLIDANWRAFTVIWKIKGNTLKVIFKIGPHGSCKGGIQCLGLAAVTQLLLQGFASH